MPLLPHTLLLPAQTLAKSGAIHDLFPLAVTHFGPRGFTAPARSMPCYNTRHPPVPAQHGNTSAANPRYNRSMPCARLYAYSNRTGSRPLAEEV